MNEQKPNKERINKEKTKDRRKERSEEEIKDVSHETQKEGKKNLYINRKEELVYKLQLTWPEVEPS